MTLFKKFFLPVTTVLFLLLVAVYVYQIPSVKQTLALATTIKPETFTELYFENHGSLPRTSQADIAETFSFTIHNLEYQTMNYPYEVYIEDIDGNRADILKDIVRLNHDESKTIPVYYQLNVQVKRAKIVVNLTSKKQSIHYWIGQEPGRVQASPSATIEPTI